MSDIDMVSALLQRGIAHKNRFRVTIPLPDGVTNSSATTKNDTNDWNSLNGSSSWNDILKTGASYLKTGVGIVNAFFGGSTEVAKSLQIMCSSSAFPGMNVDTAVMSQNGNHIKVATGISQAEVDFVFLLGVDFFEKQVLDSWKALIYDMDTGKTGYHEDYTVDICIEQLDTEDQPVHKVYITDAYPMVFSSIEVDRQAQDQFQQYNISFSFNHTMSETQYETRPASSDFLPIAITDAITSGDWITAASKAGTLYRNIKEGNFTGEALLAYRQLDAVVRSMAGVSIADFERMSVGIQRDILGNDNLTAAERTSLLQLLKDVVQK